VSSVADLVIEDLTQSLLVSCAAHHLLRRGVVRQRAIQIPVVERRVSKSDRDQHRLELLEEEVDLVAHRRSHLELLLDVRLDRLLQDDGGVGQRSRVIPRDGVRADQEDEEERHQDADQRDRAGLEQLL
jgi:hypothetical protein